MHLHSCMEKFLEREKLTEKIDINKSLLQHAVLDYFADIHRLKEFHNIDKTNEDKITAYTLFWLLKRKPLQCTASEDENPFVNECFLQSYLETYLHHDDLSTLISPEHKATFDLFFRSFLYSLKYRQMDQQAIELVILGFGQDAPFSILSIFQANRSILPPLRPIFNSCVKPSF
jgi:hypothetical protein